MYDIIPISPVSSSVYLTRWPVDSTLLLYSVMCELAAALPINAANYAYLLNTTGKTFALIAAALALLDAATTASVSAASFAAYLEGESVLPFPSYWLTIIVLIGFTVICLSGVKESVGLAFSMLCLHVRTNFHPEDVDIRSFDLATQIVTMTVLVITAIVHWARTGNEVIAQNWHDDPASGAGALFRSIFFGVCIGLLGLTGFECVPMSIELLRPGVYPQVLRNLHYGAILLDGPLMLLVFANLPRSEILSGANVLSLLGEVVASRWLRILVVVDASVVLCGGILTGFLSVDALLERLTR